MTADAARTLADRLPPGDDPDALYEAFVAWAADEGFELYPAQQEAVLELVTGAHVILSTPTGSGKSLVAVAAHMIAMAQGRRSYYTAPIKALASPTSGSPLGSTVHEAPAASAGALHMRGGLAE